jgi:hypothetical protein
MGQQQLLLIILGVIIVGIAVAVGITMFQDSALDQNKSMVISDLQNLGAKAQQYYVRPVSMGGGGNSFTSLTTDISLLASSAVTTNPNGVYTIKTNGGTSLVIHGKGTVADANGKYSCADLTVTGSGATLSNITVE